jgi:hypothetical protein
LGSCCDEMATGLGPAESDPELAFYPGAILAFCGKKSAAMHMLKNAIERDYCAYSQLQPDPLLVKLRGASEYDQLLSEETVPAEILGRRKLN